MRAARTPVRIDPAYQDPEAVRALLARGGPYWPVMRYLASEAEAESVQRGAAQPFVIPWFRADWAYGDERIDGIDSVLSNPQFIEAAQKLFDAPVVRPLVVYVNLMAPLPFAGQPHLDVPAFRGIDRTEYPVWFLHAMGRSGLFRDAQVRIATAVSWFYDGQGGAFDYWASGPNSAPQREASPFGNVAVVGDNDFMFHRVAEIGREAAELPKGLTLDSLLVPRLAGDDTIDRWEVREGDSVLARYGPDELRISVSWKAEVFDSDADLDDRLSGASDLTLDAVLERFEADLASRGQPTPRPADPLRDPAFIETLGAAYPIPEVTAFGSA